MKGVEHDDQHLVVHFDVEEPGLLAGVVDQLTEILTDALPASALAAGEREPDAAPEDPFARWEAEFSVDDGPTVENLGGADDLEPDPVVRRLFPDAYRDDPAASHDFRRFTQAAQCEAKQREAQVVLDDLQHVDRRGRCRIAMPHVGAWLKTLTNVRLALAVRLEITDEISADEAAQRPDSDPRSWLFDLYSWVGWLQECLIEALG